MSLLIIIELYWRCAMRWTTTTKWGESVDFLILYILSFFFGQQSESIVVEAIIEFTTTTMKLNFAFHFHLSTCWCCYLLFFFYLIRSAAKIYFSGANDMLTSTGTVVCWWWWWWWQCQKITKIYDYNFDWLSTLAGNQ